jgi:hypothetical protein
MNVVVIALALALGQGQGQEQQQTGGTPEAAPNAPAQQPAPAQEPEHQALTLEDALARAASENLDLRVANARLAQANTISRQVWSGQLPQITASARYTRNETEAAIQLPVGFAVRERTGGANEPPADAADLPGAPSPYFVIPSQIVDVTIQELNQLNGSIDASQVLFAPALWLAIRNSYRTESVAALNVEAARRDILFGVAQSYYAVASLRQALDVAERLLEIAQRQERDARVRFQAGTIAKVGLLRAEIDRARAEQDVRRATNQYESAKVGLATLLNRDTAFEVVDPPDPQLGGTVEELEARAVQERPRRGPERRHRAKPAEAARRGLPAHGGGVRDLPGLERRRLHRPERLLGGGPRALLEPLRRRPSRGADQRGGRADHGVRGDARELAEQRPDRGAPGVAGPRERPRERGEGAGAARARRGEPPARGRLVPGRRRDRGRAGRRDGAAPQRGDRGHHRGAPGAARRAARPPRRGRVRAAEEKIGLRLLASGFRSCHEAPEARGPRPEARGLRSEA